MPDVQHFVIATAGHVDHGKSSLVKALTGVDPDRLPEERSRGITIDLGFAHLELVSPSNPSISFSFGIVDVPGHEDFVKNMVAGVGSIDLALLVVAADDGWMPQTEEHMQILLYLGVTQAIVALTKIDLARDEGTTVAALREKLRDTPLANAPIIPTSTISGRGLDELKAALAELAAKTLSSPDIGKPRLPVDRVFNLHGVGTVVTGTLTGGFLRRGQNVVVQPSGKPARIRTLQSHNRDAETIGPGTRAALSLPGVTTNQDIHRGNLITLPAFGGSSETIDVLLEISPRARHSISDSARVWIHHASNRVAGRVAFFAGRKLNAGEAALAQLRLENTAFFFDDDRFVLRDWAEQYTLAGGIVLDADARTTAFKSEKRLTFLTQRAASKHDARSQIISLLTRDGAAEQSRLLLKSYFSEAQIKAAVSSLVSEDVLKVVGNYLTDAAHWRAVYCRAIDAINNACRAHPEHAGMPLIDLRVILRNDLLFEDMFEALVRDLCTNEYLQVGSMIRPRTHRPALPARLQAAGQKIRTALATRPFDPPSRKELSPDASSQQALRFLIETGEAVEIDADVVMAAESEKRATEIIRQFLRDNGSATVSDLRQTIGSSRRIIIPLLERLDRIGITERVHDKRTLRRQS